jgi:hypothetical protein
MIRSSISFPSRPLIVIVFALSRTSGLGYPLIPSIRIFRYSATVEHWCHWIWDLHICSTLVMASALLRRVSGEAGLVLIIKGGMMGSERVDEGERL